MIISVDEAKELVDFKGWTDKKIERKLNSIEQAIRAYTNNNFHDRGFREYADIRGGVFMLESLVPFEVGDTIEVCLSQFNGGLYSVAEISDDTTFTVVGETHDEEDVLVTKVKYPADVVDCCINLLEWEINSRSKVGIQSETLSRHSVTYFNMDGDNSVMGYPKSLLGALKPYRKARF